MADSGGAVTEGNEKNNSSCIGGTIHVTQADLIMTDVTPNAATVNQGATISVTDTVKNQGFLSTGVGFKIGYYLHPTVGADVAISTTRSVAALAAGASSSGTTNLTVPATTPANSYSVCAKADSGSVVVETNENNNTLCSTATFAVPAADLVVTVLSTTATTVKAGATAALTNAIKNQGGSKAGTFVVAFHLSTNTTYGDSDDYVSSKTRTIGALAIGATNSTATYVTVPAATPPGTYHICAKADDDITNTYHVDESDETNNTRCTPTTITVMP
jgi:subtilase family serine protease